MKIKKLLIACVGAALGIVSMSGCVAKVLEKEINVVFTNEGSIVDSGKVTQFQNIKSPVLDDAYIPTDYRFLGWTCYSYDQLDFSDPAHFKTQYIGGGRMVHYMDIEKFVQNSEVTCEALIVHKDDIPKEYHYAVVAWYDKASNSGITQAVIDTYQEMTLNYLRQEGVSEEDLATVVFRGYSGNVGPTTGQIVYDNDVDIMLGWGSVDNITTTGSIPVDSILQTASYPILYEGTVKNRYVHRLGDSVGALKVMEYLLSEESTNYFNPPAEA